MSKNYWAILKQGCKMKTRLSLLFLLIFPRLLWAQLGGEVRAAVDSTQVLIGAQLNYTLQVKTDSLAQISFPDPLAVAPFEVLESFPIDTLQAQQHYLFTKKYALIQFDSGRYYIPPQRIMIDGFAKMTDSIKVEVTSVVVDTLKQKMYDIKPQIQLDKNYRNLLARLLWVLLVLGLLIGGLWAYFSAKRKRALREAALPPFERAIEALKALENSHPKAQEEYKDYYSKLTEIVRRYLEEEAKIDALESTSSQLLNKLLLLKDAGKIPLEKETLKNLKEVLETADLVKFARAVPETGTAPRDREWVEAIVVETKEVLPEPTPEELQAQEEYRLLMLKKKRKQQLVYALSGLGSLLVLALLSSMAYYGYYPVRDTLLGYPTKKLDNQAWVSSRYGAPPVELLTPEVLLRKATSAGPNQSFEMDSLGSPFYIALAWSSKPPTPNQQEQNDGIVNEEETQALIDGILATYQELGATNMLVDSEVVTTAKGLPALKISGTLDYAQTGESQKERFIFSTLLFDFDQGKITLTMTYPKDDRYGPQIAQRVEKSIDLIKEL